MNDKDGINIKLYYHFIIHQVFHGIILCLYKEYLCTWLKYILSITPCHVYGTLSKMYGLYGYISITNLVQIIMCSCVGHRGFCWLSCKRVNTMFGWTRERWKYGLKPFLKGYILHKEKRNKIWMVSKHRRAIIFFSFLSWSCSNMSLYTLKVWQVYDTLYCFIL